MVKEILLNGKKHRNIVLIDDEDFELVNRYEWFLKKDGARNYVCCNTKLGRIMLHRLIMNLTNSRLVVDHINHNALDNRKENLRICTSAENSKNCTKTANKRTSKYKGVCWEYYRKKWIVSVSKNFKNIHLGCFDDEELAAKNYDYWAKVVYGEFACLNFPDFDYNDFKPKKNINDIENRKYHSEFRGVSKSAKGGGFRSEIRINKKLYYIGYYYTELDAAKHYDYIFWLYYGNKTKLNFLNINYDGFKPFNLSKKIKILLDFIYVNKLNFHNNYPIYIDA